MESGKKVSVIIPVYNGQKYITRCLDAVAGQSFDDYEILIIDDGSTDGTFQKLKQYWEENREKKNPKLKIFARKNAGAAAARNFGLENARGEYLAFIDVDDFVEPDYLEKLYETAKSCNADVVSCGYRTVDSHGKVVSKVCVSPFAEVSDYGRAGVFVVWSKLFRTKFLRENKIMFPEGGFIYEDVPFSLEAKFLGKRVKALSYIGYSYMLHEDSTMATKNVTDHQFPYQEMRRVLHKIAGTQGDDRRFEFEVLHFFAGFLFLYCRGFSRDSLGRLCDFAQEQVRELFPRAFGNPYLGIFRSRELPLVYRMAILVFHWSLRLGFLKPLTCLISAKR